MAPGFKRTYCHDCRPHLIGVWDTVASMGWFWGRKFFDSTLNHDVKYGYHAVSIDERRKKFPANMWSEDAKADHQTIEQVWFAGVHSDVGGWYTDAGLSDIALEWMLNRAEARGLRLRPDWRARLSPDPAGRLHVSRAGFWQLWRPAPRTIPEGARIHRSVLARMEDPALGYAPANLPGRYEVVE